MQETGVRNGAYGADKFGFKDLGRGSLEPDRAVALRARDRRGRSVHRRRRRALRRDRPSHRPLARRTSTPSSTISPRTSCGGTAIAKCRRRTSTILLADFQAHVEGQDAVRAGSLRRRRSEIPDQDPRLHRTRLALAVHPPAADPPGAGRTRQLRARADHRRSAVVQAGRQASRRPRRLRHDGGDRFHPQDRADLRLVLRGRDEEVGVHDAQLLSAGAERRADALLGQCQPRRRERAVLRPVRHRQDHAVGRSASAS